MTPALLRRIGEALYGPRWQSDLAAALGMSARHMRRLATGVAPISGDTAADLRELLEQRLRTIEVLLRKE